MNMLPNFVFRHNQQKAGTLRAFGRRVSISNWRVIEKLVNELLGSQRGKKASHRLDLLGHIANILPR